MADDSNKIWVDSSFTSPYISKKDINVGIQLSNSDNIGSYSMPVIYKSYEEIEDKKDILINYFNETFLSDNFKNILNQYYVHTGILEDDIHISLVEFSSGQKDLILNKNIGTIYTTGYNAISGTLNRAIVFTSGKQYITVDNIPLDYSHYTSLSGILDYIINYTNFTGGTGVSGIPIPYTNDFLDRQVIYTTESNDNLGNLNKIIDVSFAGWINFPINADIYSSDMDIIKGYTGEITTISGNVQVHYLNVFSSEVGMKNQILDVYSSLMNFKYFNSEFQTIDGGIGYINQDIYSTIETFNSLKLDISLFSLKISNFSLDEGEYTTASGFVSIDITDDICPVSMSGSYFLLDGTKVPVTFSNITNGYRMYYDPEDDFNSIEGPITFTARAENECGDVLEQDFYLTFGYIVEYKNHPSIGMDYGFDNKVAVRVTAENYATCQQVESLAWDFESRQLNNCDLGASIVGRYFDLDTNDLSAKIFPHSTAYFYGKEITVVLKAKDFAGNKMEDFVLTYRIEDKPN